MLYITEYARIAIDSGHNVTGVPQLPPLAEQALDIGVASEQSAVFNSSASFIFVSTTENCCLAFGPDPKANPKLHRLSAGAERWYGLPGPGQRLAVISSEE